MPTDLCAGSASHSRELSAQTSKPALQEFYAPIITAYEAHIAFALGQSWTGDYRTNFACLLVKVPGFQLFIGLLAVNLFPAGRGLPTTAQTSPAC